jgi:hypothetical protein
VFNFFENVEANRSVILKPLGIDPSMDREPASTAAVLDNEIEEQQILNNSNAIAFHEKLSTAMRAGR